MSPEPELCAGCPHDLWQHEPLGHCRLCVAIDGTVCMFASIKSDPCPWPFLRLFRRSPK